MLQLGLQLGGVVKQPVPPVVVVSDDKKSESK